MFTNLLSIVFFLTGMIGLIVSAIIVCKKENRFQSLMLSLCIFALSCSCIYNIYTGSIYFYADEVAPLKCLAFIVAPCAYLYTKKIINPSFNQKWYLINFLPALAFLIYSFSKSNNYASSGFWLSSNHNFTSDFNALNLMFNLMWLLYAYTQVLIMFTKTKRILPSKEKVLWLKYFSFFILSLFVGLFIQKIYTFNTAINFNVINNIIISLLLLGTAYITFYKPSVFLASKEYYENQLIDSKRALKDSFINIEVKACKTQANILSNEKILDYSTQIEKALTDKPFLKKGFVIRDLSELTGIPVHHLSHFINSHYNLHFQDFINKKRIEYLIQQLDDSEWKSLSLEGQAWAVGFKSRTTFFRAFTKLIGKSPSEYLNSLNEAKLKKLPATA